MSAKVLDLLRASPLSPGRCCPAAAIKPPVHQCYVCGTFVRRTCDSNRFASGHAEVGVTRSAVGFDVHFCSPTASTPTPAL